MKKIFNPTKMFVTVMMLGCALGFTSCSDDDDDTQNPTEVTTNTMYGNYSGKMAITSPKTQENSEESEGIEVKANVKDNTVYLEDLPLQKIITALFGDEAAVINMVKLEGDVDYSIAYTPTLSSAKDMISMKFNAEPLKLELKSVVGDEQEVFNIEAEVEANEDGTYKVEDGSLAFTINITKVFRIEGEEKEEQTGLTPAKFDFKLTQDKIAHRSGF